MVVNGGVEVQGPGGDLLQNSHAGEQLGDRRGVEPGVDGVRDPPAGSGEAVRTAEHRFAGATEDDDTAEVRSREMASYFVDAVADGHQPM